MNVKTDLFAIKSITPLCSSSFVNHYCAFWAANRAVEQCPAVTSVYHLSWCALPPR